MKRFVRIISCLALLASITLLAIALQLGRARGAVIMPPASKGYDWAAVAKFWSFQPIHRPPVPHPADPSGWLRTPIDAFVLDHLRSKGLSPAPPADKGTLIRRATFDLLGLPPTAQELRNFLADDSPNAYEKLIDRLLASPHYGEKWGRHWLDVVRYTPGRVSFPGVKHTAGDSQYRDYVVRSFNEDKPYDRFVTEQLAGDLLPVAADKQAYFDQITAPAMLSIGPWFDQETDPNRLRMDMIDDMIGVTGKTFLGLSLQCARCHDHKFDPVPTADYYALAGIFRSTRIVGEFSNYWRDGRVRLLRPLAMPDETAANDLLKAKIAAIKAQQWKALSDRHAELMAKWQGEEARYRAEAAKLPHPYTKVFEAEDFDGVYNLRIADLSSAGKVVQVIETLNSTFQWVRYKLNIPEEGTYRLEALYSADDNCPLTVQVNGTSVTEKALGSPTGGWDLTHRRWELAATFDLRAGLNFLRLTRKEGSFPRIDKFRLCKVEPTLDGAIEGIRQKKGSDPFILANMVKDPEHPWPTVAEIRPYLSPEARSQIEAMDADIQTIESKITPHPLIVAVSDAAAPADMPIHPRGAAEAVSGDPIPRTAPRFLDPVLPRPIVPSGDSGRLQLARWITDERNPLTARVMANRVWLWHFGRGLVETPSDFGSRGSPPTNPELLDWIASELMHPSSQDAPRSSDSRASAGAPSAESAPGGATAGSAASQVQPAAVLWSLKHLHRLIMLSSAYRMSSVANAAALALDPDNSHLTRFSARRLEAEELFDSMFSSTNILIHQPSGQPLDLQKSLGRGMYVLTTNRAPPNLGPEVRKMFVLFDLDLSGATVDRRQQSSTAASALFWLNSPLPKYYADRFADRLLKMDKLSDAKRLDQAYLIAFSHSPAPDVSRLALEYLQELRSQGLSPRAAWSQICLAIYASDEFHRVE